MLRVVMMPVAMIMVVMMLVVMITQVTMAMLWNPVTILAVTMPVETLLV